MADGEILGVLGRNGMGKTTLIRCIAGLIPASAGALRFDGPRHHRPAAARRARLGITTIVQGRGIFPRMTRAREPGDGPDRGRHGQAPRLDEVLGYFPRLEERLGQRAGTMSGGEQQMLAIGRGLMTDPQLMLLDEPSDGIMPDRWWRRSRRCWSRSTGPRA